MSPSARKVWIEMDKKNPLKERAIGHLPQGRCGLKCRHYAASVLLDTSPSARKVWIEIARVTNNHQTTTSPSARKVWIEIVALTIIVAAVPGHLPQGRCGLKLRCILRKSR